MNEEDGDPRDDQFGGDNPGDVRLIEEVSKDENIATNFFVVADDAEPA